MTIEAMTKNRCLPNTLHLTKISKWPSILQIAVKHPIFSRIAERHLYADIFPTWRGCPCTPDNFCYHMIAFVLPRRSMLPVEILDNIFSRLDSCSLEASSAAHHLFSCIAERHLYADICLDALTIETQWVSDSKTSITVVQLSNLLEERPHIANYVFSLTIVLSDEIAESSLPFMTLLRNLNKLTIENRSGVHKFKKLTLPQSLQLSLENCLRLPSMQELEVTGIEIPFSFLHHCKGLKTLKVEGCAKLARPELDSSNDSPFLKDLIVIDVRVQALMTLAPRMAKCCKRLQHFTVSPYYNDTEAFLAIEPIFISCSNTLTSLDVDLGFLCKLIPYFHSELIYQIPCVRLIYSLSDPKPSISPSSQRSHSPRESVLWGKNHKALRTLFGIHRPS